MKHYLAKEKIAYTGEQLRSNFAYKEFDVVGDSIVAFCGPCDIKIEEIVDIEDLKAGNQIYSESMLHFIVEHHDTDLEKGVLRQLVLACIIKDTLNDILHNLVTRRVNADLYDGDAKLSISVATATPVSSVIHFGINISSANTPVKTKGLEDYGVDPVEFANTVMEKYVRDMEGLYNARCKVRWSK
jgi:hypothetical protein